MYLLTADEAFRILCYALAVFRFTYLLWWENGPFDLIDWLRAKAGVFYDYTDTVRMGKTFLAKVLNCPHCLSSYISLVAIVGFMSYNYWIDLFALWGAVWAVPLLLFGYKKAE